MAPELARGEDSRFVRFRLLAIVAGAIIANVASLVLQGAIPVVGAAWCWKNDPPQCDALVVTNGRCKEGQKIAAGSLCTAECDAGMVPTGDCTIQCPPSEQGTNAEGGCFGDVGNDWWVTCGSSKTTCAASLPLSKFGDFKCVAQGEATAASCNFAVLATVAEDQTTSWDAWTLVLLGALLLVAIVSVLIGQATTKGYLRGLASMIFKPVVMGHNIANIVGYVAIFVAMILYAALLPRVGMLHVVFISGKVAGVALSLPFVWAFFRLGVHNAACMSREAAWRVHIMLGDIALLFGTLHGIFSFAELGTAVFDNGFWVLGLVGLVLMLLGVSPALPTVLGKLHYDRFKLLHFVSMWGYLFAIVHMIEHAVVRETIRVWAVTFLNIAALLAFLVQKFIVKCKARPAKVLEAELLSEVSGGQHVLLKLKVLGYRFQPGQWCHLSIPKLSPVPHPFTIVPGSDEDELRLMVKASGKFTKSLADVCASNALIGEQQQIKLEGPYGSPPSMFGWHSVIFVLGGVGVTPGLSLVKHAVDGGGKVRVFWSVRSLGLLNACAPLLEPYLKDSGSHHIRLSAGAPVVSAEDGEALKLPLGAQTGKADLRGWISSIAADIPNAGRSEHVLLFVCGPDSLAKAVASASREQTIGWICWHLHVEEFRFLPPKPSLCARRSDPAKPPSVGADRIGRSE